MPQDPPIFHIHVKIIENKFRNGSWYALLREPSGDEIWMNQPCEWEVGSEQILYIVRRGTSEWQSLENLVKSGQDPQKWLEELAKKWGVWCEKTWDEAAQGMDRSRMN